MNPNTLLVIGLTNVISEPTFESALEIISKLTGCEIRSSAFAAAIAALLRDGLIREPIRLEPQALQCHWRLELTPEGVALARTLTGA